MIEIRPELFHPETFDRTPYFGAQMADSLLARGREVLNDTEDMEDPNVTVVIRTRNDVGQLEVLDEELDRQNFDGDIQMVVVDTESNDGTVQYARSIGAEVVPIEQAAFSYPEALNRGFEAADHPYIVTLVGHSALASDVMLRGVTRYSQDAEFGGAYGVSLPDINATWTERLGAVVLGVPKLLGPAEAVTKDGLGVMASNAAVVSRAAWREAGTYDLAYGAGGEDNAFARQLMAIGATVVREPVMSVHHTHGLGPIDGFQQMRYWQSLAKPHDFNAARLHSYRPDLRAKNQ